MPQDIEFTIEQFITNIKEDKNHRYKSWEYCYAFFQQNRENIIDEKIDLACLNLAFYLASWGMYRGSSGLLWKDYKVYYPIICELMQEKYQALAHLKLDIAREEIENKVDLLFNLVNKLRGIIENIKYRKNDGGLATVSATDTLLTKIIMGTLGCTPAYDLFFKKGCKKVDISPYSNFTKDSYRTLVKFYRENSSEFNKASRKLPSDIETNYPHMKLLDMYFWQLGNSVQKT